MSGQHRPSPSNIRDPLQGSRFVKRTEFGWTLAAALVIGAPSAAGAQDRPAGDGRKPAAEPPKAEQSVTQHTLAIGGKSVSLHAPPPAP